MSLYNDVKAEKGSPISKAPASIYRLNKPKPDNWYIMMMVKRLRWAGCEDRERVISIFRLLWSDFRVADRAEEFYDEAVKIIESEGI